MALAVLHFSFAAALETFNLLICAVFYAGSAMCVCTASIISAAWLLMGRDNWV